MIGAVAWKKLSLVVAASLAIGSNAQTEVKSGMTSDSHCGKDFCFTAMYVPRDKHIMYTLVVQSDGPAVGWYGVGQGEGMKGANMAVNWANADGSVTTSHRSANGEEYPSEQKASGLAKLTVNNMMDFSNNSKHTIWSWSIDQETAPSNKMPHIYAHSPKTPASSNTSSPIGMHSETDHEIVLDLTKAYDGKAPAGLDGSFVTGNASAGAQRDLSQAKVRLYLAHMILMILAWMLFVPMGIFVARFGRGRFTWFPVHQNIQSFAYLIVVIAAIIATFAVKKEPSGHSLGKHAKSGFGVMILFIVQALLGSTAHHYRAKTGKRYVGYVHMPLGVLIVAASTYTIGLGFDKWEWDAPKGAKYFIFEWAAFLACVYLLGLLLIPRQKKLEQAKQLQRHVQRADHQTSEPEKEPVTQV